MTGVPATAAPPEVSAAARVPPPLDEKLEKLVATVREARPKDDIAPVEKAFQYAAQYHAGQMRASGEPYLMHPLAVAQILADMRMDVVSIETGLLHDIVEDTSVTTADIQKNFGEEVARCVAFLAAEGQGFITGATLTINGGQYMV